MIVIVKDIVNETERAFSGDEIDVEDQIRRAYPGLSACVSSGNLDGLLHELGTSYGKLLEIPEGHLAKPELHLPVRFDIEPHNCERQCPYYTPLALSEWPERLEGWLLEKAIMDIKPGDKSLESTQLEANSPRVDVYDYTHLLPEHTHGKYRLHLIEYPRGYHDREEENEGEKPIPSHQKRGRIKIAAHIIKHPFDFIDDDVGKVSAMIHPKWRNGDRDLRIGLSDIYREHRGQGLGKCLYEAVMAHGKHYHGCSHIAGGVHSTLAHHVHQALSMKHGMEYHGEETDSPDVEDFGPHEFDGAYGPYMYAIKSEEPLAKSFFRAASFRNRLTGQMHETGAFHNIYELPEDWHVDEDHLDHIEAGFTDHAGKFYTRKEASDAQGRAEGAGLQSEDMREQGLGRQTGQENTGGGMGLVKMAISDIPPGKLEDMPGVISHGNWYNYQHVLSPVHRRNYSLYIKELESGGMTRKFMVNLRSRRRKDPLGQPLLVGHTDMMVTGNDAEESYFGQEHVAKHPGHRHVTVNDTRLFNQYRGKALGAAMYEAGFAHAKHIHHATHVRGSTHSTSAHYVHQKLAEKHGLHYEAEFLQDPSYQSKDYDGAYGPYHYNLKNELPIAKNDQDDALLAIASNLNDGSNDQVSEIAEDMVGFAPQAHGAFEAARFLAGSGERLSIEQIRRALWQEDGDFECAALRAYNLEPDDKNIRGLRAVMKLRSIYKMEASRDTHVDAPIADSAEVAGEVQRAFRAGSVQAVNLNGKYSKGSMVSRDPVSQNCYLLKPDSEGKSPAAGVEEQHISQPRREAAFWHVADVFGLGGFIPSAHLLLIDGEEWAAIKLLPYNYKNLERKWKMQSGHVMTALERYRSQGLLHKWAAIDYVLGNPDRHGQNLMIGHDEDVTLTDKDIALIDHGSAFAGYGFSPSTDNNSFIPFYLRAWTNPKGFNKLTPTEKLKTMPTVNGEVNGMLKDWIRDLNEQRILGVIKQYGIDSGPILSRLAKLKMMIGIDEPDIAIDKLWVGA